MEDVLLQSHSTAVSDKPKWQDWLRLSLTPHIGLQMQHRLVTVFGSASAVFEQSELSLQTQVSEAQARALQQFPPDWDTGVAGSVTAGGGTSHLDLGP